MALQQFVILAAGMGTRLGRPHPKPLTRLADGRSILRQQLDNIAHSYDGASHVTIVVGFKMHLIMEQFPHVSYIYNPDYSETNTAKSLLKALQLSHDGGVLWMNGDVVFDARILDQTKELVAQDQSFICVNTAHVGDEEIKYTVDENGWVRQLSKTVAGGLGEALGINYVSAADKAILIEHLQVCDDQDYFERGIETAISEAGLRFLPINIDKFAAVEVDFEADLDRANATLIADFDP